MPNVNSTIKQCWKLGSVKEKTAHGRGRGAPEMAYPECLERMTTSLSPFEAKYEGPGPDLTASYGLANCSADLQGPRSKWWAKKFFPYYLTSLDIKYPPARTVERARSPSGARRPVYHKHCSRWGGDVLVDGAILSKMRICCCALHHYRTMPCAGPL